VEEDKEEVSRKILAQIISKISLIIFTRKPKNMMKTKLIPLFLAVILLFTACSVPPTAAPTATPQATAITLTTAVVKTAVPNQGAAAVPARVNLKTAVGDMVYTTARFVNEANSTRPEPGKKLLLVFLERADKSSIDLQKWVDARQQIFIRGDDGSETLSTMGGFVDNQFAIGFQVPETVKTYQLVWGDNPVFPVIPAE
jgi:hypothetical protein